MVHYKWYQINFLYSCGDHAFKFVFVDMRLVPVTIEEVDYELYEEDYNSIDEEPTCSTSSHFTYKDDDEFYVSTYDELMRSRSIHDGLYCRGRPKASIIYLIEY